MNGDKIDSSALRALSTDELAKALYAISISMGASEAKAVKAANNAYTFKRMLEKATDADLARILSSVGEEKAKQILNDIKDKK